MEPPEANKMMEGELAALSTEQSQDLNAVRFHLLTYLFSTITIHLLFLSRLYLAGWRLILFYSL
jgi:hypothetical protein